MLNIQEYERTPLLAAIMAGHDSTVRCLLQLGADANIVDVSETRWSDCRCRLRCAQALLACLWVDFALRAVLHASEGL